MLLRAFNFFFGRLVILTISAALFPWIATLVIFAFIVGDMWEAIREPANTEVPG